MNAIFEKLMPPPPKITVGINGFGRIGRAFMRVAAASKDIDVVAINDLGDVKNLAYLLKYDTAYKSPDFKIEAGEGFITVGRKKVKVLSEKDPANIPWKKLGVDVVVESTGVFESYEKASGHLKGGASRVVITAPLKNDTGATGPSGETVLVGVNEDALGASPITSNASCTTNAGSPLIAILDEALGIEKALLSTVHAYTATQSIVDSPVKGSDLRRGRAAAQNIVPSSTGAAIAVTEAYPNLKGLFDGISLRVPVVTGSIVDITFVSKKETTTEEVNLILEHAATEHRWQGIFAVTREQLVSSDIIGNSHASIADLAFTRVVGGNLIKVLAWYDNEMGYVHTLLRHVRQAARHI
jgi:glyceraldehyde 3-phosphate dehydrogenase